jgi:hypothetical protein
MTNVQQPEMRRNGKNPTVQDSKGPDSSDRQTPAKGGQARPVPPEQVSPYGPTPRPVVDRGQRDER